MKIRIVRLLTALFFAFVFLMSGCSAKKPAPEKNVSDNLAKNQTPHVFIYLIDALRPDHLSVNGYFRETDPEIKKFSRDAVVFKRAYTQAPWTRPSVASLFTGLFPPSHGVENRNDSLPSEHHTLSEVLQEDGFLTVAISTNPNVFGRYGFGEGFDEYIKVKGKGLMKQERGGGEKPYAPADRLIEEFSAFLERKPEGSIFCYIHTLDPHYPYEPPAPYDTLFTGSEPFTAPDGRKWPVSDEINAYDGEAAFSDHQFGKFLDLLKKKGLYDNSIIILLSDHGEELHDHGGKGHGVQAYEEVIRMVLMMKLPRGLHAGSIVRAPVRMIDIMPAILDLLGIKDESKREGESFVKLLSGKNVTDWNPVLFSETFLDGMEIRSWISGDYKLIDWKKPRDEFYLFDLKNDPGETRDLADADKDLLQKMKDDMYLFYNGINHGIFVEMINGGGLDESHRIKGRIKVKSGAPVEFKLWGMEKVDTVKVVGNGNILVFNLQMKNVPTGQKKIPFLKSVKKIQIISPATDLKAALYIEADGTPLGPDDFIIGNDGKLKNGNGPPFMVKLMDKSTMVEAGSSGRRPPDTQAPACRIYYIPGITPGQVEPDAETKKQLKSLGYIH